MVSSSLSSLWRRVSFSGISKKVFPKDESAVNVAPRTAVETDTLQIPDRQEVLLLYEAGQPYVLTKDYPIPQLVEPLEVLIRSETIGLNPIDWKAPDFNFAIPELPYISGRELAGSVAKINPGSNLRLKLGDRVTAISTDYRDLRKAAYQEYAVAHAFNVVRLPDFVSFDQGATFGVAFVASAISLGICLGLDFSHVKDGPDLLNIVRSLEEGQLPEDIRFECLENMAMHERAKPGDWVAISGGSSTSANLALQLARLAGLRVALIVDKAKHGLRLSDHSVLRPDLLVDSHDSTRAAEIIRSNTQGKLRFGIDTQDRKGAANLLKALVPGHQPTSHGAGMEPIPSPPETPSSLTLLSAHLVGLSGLPKTISPEGTVFHSVPIKIFHEVPSVGGSLVLWLERLLEHRLIIPPEIIDVEIGLDRINNGLDRMRRREISGGKLVVRVQ